MALLDTWLCRNKALQVKCELEWRPCKQPEAPKRLYLWEVTSHITVCLPAPGDEGHVSLSRLRMGGVSLVYLNPVLYSMWVCVYFLTLGHINIQTGLRVRSPRMAHKKHRQYCFCVSCSSVCGCLLKVIIMVQNYKMHKGRVCLER